MRAGLPTVAVARRPSLTSVTSADDADDGRAPICPACGVTALPAELSNVIDAGFLCENPDCDAFGDPVGD